MSYRAGIVVRSGRDPMISGLAKALEGALHQRGVGDIWWGARILEAWPHVVGARFAKRSKPVLDRSSLQEKGLLIVAVQGSSWIHALSLIDVAGHLNHQLGKPLVRKVRFELREVLP